MAGQDTAYIFDRFVEVSPGWKDKRRTPRTAIRVKIIPNIFTPL
jgi:hypothetical protein